MRSSRFFIRVLLSYSYLFIGLFFFGTVMMLLPGFLLHPFTIAASIAFVAGWIWVAKTYLGFSNSAHHKHEGT